MQEDQFQHLTHEQI
jgi:beta-catenin-like protein 1